MPKSPHGNRHGQDVRDQFVDLICKEGLPPARAATGTAEGLVDSKTA